VEPPFSINIDSDADIGLTLTTRVDDIAFVHQQMRNDSFVKAFLSDHALKQGQLARMTTIVGHSLGGTAAVAAMLADLSICGGVNLNGTMFEAVVNSGLD
jgi:pimeloyl-ACP methyl ester carboxylesterase